MKHLVELRNERKISQAELGELLHMSQQAICKYENGYCEPDINTLISIADIFHTTIDYLVGRDDGVSKSKDDELLIENQLLSRNEIIHLIEYRKLSEKQQEHVDFLIHDLIEK